MGKRHELTFQTYDRLFPNQDTLPKGGLGNLIALPLQQVARKNNNSVFIDENFEAYPDQWSFLYNIRKLSMSEIELYISKFNGNELGDLRLSEDEESKPWERTKVVHRSGKYSNYHCQYVVYTERRILAKSPQCYQAIGGI